MLVILSEIYIAKETKFTMRKEQQYLGIGLWKLEQRIGGQH